MIIEDEGEAAHNWSSDSSFQRDAVPPPSYDMGSPYEFQEYIRRRCELRDREMHHQLRHDLVEHLWERYGSDE